MKESNKKKTAETYMEYPCIKASGTQPGRFYTGKREIRAIY